MIYENYTLNKATIENLFSGNGSLQRISLFMPEDAFTKKGRLFSHISLKPNVSIGMHRHSNEFELYYILKGDGTYNDNGTFKNIKAGDVTLCNDGEMHGLENTGKEDLEIIALIIYS